MVNNEAFVGRLKKILDHYGLTASVFADKVGVQRSGISHLLSGRNKPSLEFVMKVIQNFPEVNLYWLLNGKGNFPAPVGSKQESHGVNTNAASEEKAEGKGGIDKIIIFYKDGSFESYNKQEN